MESAPSALTRTGLLALQRGPKAPEETPGRHAVDPLLAVRVDPDAQSREGAVTAKPRIEVLDLHLHGDSTISVPAVEVRACDR
jgi:hypothetical protein